MGELRTYTETISIPTKGDNDIVDISEHISSVIQNSAVEQGIVSVSVPHTTCALTAMELEPGTEADLREFLEAWVPANGRYHHNLVNHDTNGHAHLRASLLGPSLQLPIAKGRLVLGTWQTPVLIDCDDRPRQRQLVVTVIGATP